MSEEVLEIKRLHGTDDREIFIGRDLYNIFAVGMMWKC
jgi:hypothetical protein